MAPPLTLSVSVRRLPHRGINMHKTVASFKLLLHFTLGSPPVYMTLSLSHSVFIFLLFLSLAVGNPGQLGATLGMRALAPAYALFSCTICGQCIRQIPSAQYYDIMTLCMGKWRCHLKRHLPHTHTQRLAAPFLKLQFECGCPQGVLHE